MADIYIKVFLFFSFLPLIIIGKHFFLIFLIAPLACLRFLIKVPKDYNKICCYIAHGAM